MNGISNVLMSHTIHKNIEKPLFMLLTEGTPNRVLRVVDYV